MNKDNLIEFAKEQCEIFPEDSYMGEYLREILKMLQVEPCEDVISRKETVDFLRNCVEDYEDKKLRVAFRAASSLVENVDNIPPVTPTRKKWKWIVEDSGNYNGKYSTCYCGNCKDYYTRNWREMNYCPNCGAEMESEE